MDRMKDLDAALQFVIGRIEEQAMLSGQPLDEDERFLLNNLPSKSSTPVISIGDPKFPLHFTPRDFTYERLCTLAKAARRSDTDLNPTSLDWDFAWAVAKLNGHPLSWLLQWAGVKQRRPWWDGWLMFVAALLFIAATAPLMFLVIDKPPALWRWTAVAMGYLGTVLCMYYASRRIERGQLARNVERCRMASRFASTLPSG
jgi:hypothetical protein